MDRQNTGYPDIIRAVAKFRQISATAPDLAIVLGSGFGAVADNFAGEWLAAAQIPGYPNPRVAGHAGRIGWGTLSGVKVLLISGRTHYYESRNIADVTFAVRALAEYGVKNLLLTNAAGALNPRWRRGDLMVVRDHINFMGVNPLCEMGWNGVGDFLDLSAVYDAEFGKWLKRAGKEAKCPMREGVYLAVSGPSYETPAEITAFRRWGASAVGMSTVPEAIMARRLGLRVAALSGLTNMAAGLAQAPISHDEVMASGVLHNRRNSEVIRIFVRMFAKSINGN
jgi:purine-nucleoside phosphorylase